MIEVPAVVRMKADMMPWRKGQDAVIQDPDLLAKLIEDDLAEDVRPYPPPDVAPPARASETVTREAEKPRRRIFPPKRGR